MNALKKTSATLIAFAISASAFAGSDLETRVHELEKKIDMMSTTTAANTFGPKLALARPEPNGSGWFLTFDVLYWQSKVGGLTYATAVAADVFTPILRDGSPREPEFDWSFAFKVGIGYKFFYDGWDTHFEYTYFRNDGKDSYSVTAPAAILPQNSNIFLLTATTVTDVAIHNISDFCTQASADVKLSFNDINWDLGRDFFVSKNLSLRPSMGLKASWIALKASAKYTGGGVAYTYPVGLATVVENGLGVNTLYAVAHQKFVGVGPRGAIDTKWHLCNDISIYGDLAGALLFGYINTDFDATYSALSNNFAGYDDKYHRLVPTVDFELGLMYDKYMMCDTQHFSISLGYETQYFWESNFLTFEGNTTPQGVGMYGVNLDIRWDF